MTSRKAVPTTVFCVALMGATFAPSAKADAWNRKTVTTLDRPVETPAVHLAGWAVLPVLFTPAEIPLEVALPVTSTDATLVVQVKQVPVLAIQPSGQEVEVAQVPSPPPDLATVAGLSETTLPKTANPAPRLAARIKK